VFQKLASHTFMPVSVASTGTWAATGATVLSKHATSTQ
jgi:hypothetical protein